MRDSKQKKSNRKKLISILFAALVVALAGFTVYYVYGQIKDGNSSTESPSTKTSSESHNSTDSKATSESTYNNTTTDKIPKNANISIAITTLNQTDSAIVFSATVASTASDGKCALTITNPNDKPVSRTVNATHGTTTSECGPISIPVEEFSYLGDWTATLRYYTNGTQTVASKIITIR